MATAQTHSAPGTLETHSANQATSVALTSEAVADARGAVAGTTAKDKPRGWRITGTGVASCSFESDHHYAQQGVSSALLQSSNSDVGQWCAILQSSASGQYKGRRIQFSAYLSTQNSPVGAALWFRADDTQKAVPVTGRPISPQNAVINSHLDVAALRPVPENLGFEETFSID
ncbi:MAG TPA: hypothetical protein VGI65_00815 [Steroidobacteraceae bacterium]|jgi:hypothetical protein